MQKERFPVAKSTMGNVFFFFNLIELFMKIDFFFSVSVETSFFLYWYWGVGDVAVRLGGSYVTLDHGFAQVPSVAHYFFKVSESPCH